VKNKELAKKAKPYGKTLKKGASDCLRREGEKGKKENFLIQKPREKKGKSGRRKKAWAKAPRNSGGSKKKRYAGGE